MTHEQRIQQLQDRQDYRTTLINRGADIGRKIAHVEEQIKKLKNPKE